MRLRVVVLWNIGEREAMFPLVCHILEGNGLAVRGRPGMMVKRSVRKLLNSFFFFLRCALTVYLGLKLAMFLPLLSNDQMHHCMQHN